MQGGGMEKLPIEMESNIFSRLPFDSVINIFSRLPFDSVMQCRCVSKSWCNILQLLIYTSGERYFAQLHRTRRLFNQNHHHSFPDSVPLLLGQFTGLEQSSYFTKIRRIRLLDHVNHHRRLNSSSLPDSVIFLFDRFKQLYYAEYNEDDQNGFNCKVIKKFNSPLTRNSKFWKMATSSNGLICSVRKKTDDSSWLYIYNPFLGEYVTLPKFKYQGKRKRKSSKIKYEGKSSMAFGFGHIPSTDEYKVVRIIYPLVGGGGEAEVYTLGEKNNNRKWRRNRNIKCRLQCDSPGVLVNGSLCWLTERDHSVPPKKQRIVKFDLLEEKFISVYHKRKKRILLPPVLPTNFKIQELGGDLCGVHCIHKIRTRVMWKKVDQILFWPSNSSSLICAADVHNWGLRVNMKDFSCARRFHGIFHMKSLVSFTALGEYNTKTVEERIRKRHKRKRENNKDKEKVNTDRQSN